MPRLVKLLGEGICHADSLEHHDITEYVVLTLKVIDLAEDTLHQLDSSEDEVIVACVGSAG
jgi:hypothetical protein